MPDGAPPESVLLRDGESFLTDRLGESKPCTALENIRANVESACRRGLPQVPRFDGHDREMVVCAGGPSLNRNLEEIRRKSKCGAAVVAVNQTSGHLLVNDIVPQAIVLVDPQEVLASQFAVHDGPNYLVASQCHPTVFDRLIGKKILIFHTQGDAEKHWILPHYPDPVFAPSGTTAALRTIDLAYILGFRKLHFYGLDGSFEADHGEFRHHAYAQPEDDRPACIEVICRDANSERRFLTRADYARQANEFMDILHVYHHFWKTGDAERLRVFVHGDGLIPYIWRKRRHELH